MTRKPKYVDFHFDEHSLSDDAELFSFGKPADNQPVKCICGWLGTFGQTHERRYTSGPESWAALGGRDGWEYHCPKCDNIVGSYYFRMS